MLTWLKWKLWYSHLVFSKEMLEDDRVDILKLYMQYGSGKVNEITMRFILDYRARECFLYIAPMFEKEHLDRIIHKFGFRLIFEYQSRYFLEFIKNIRFLCDIGKELGVDLSIFTAAVSVLRGDGYVALEIFREYGVPWHPMACATALAHYSFESLRYLYVYCGAPWTLRETYRDLEIIYNLYYNGINWEIQFGGMRDQLIFDVNSGIAMKVLRYKWAVRVIEKAWLQRKFTWAAMVISRAWLERYYAPGGRGAEKAKINFNKETSSSFGAWY
jgi:hypothetical protein